MKLFELTGYKKYTHLTLTGLAKELYGTKGTFGIAVFTPDAVYKAWVKDEAYEHWFEFIKANQGNPWLPKIIKDVKTIKSPLKNRDSIRVAKLERLSKLGGTRSSDLVANMFDDYTADTWKKLATFYQYTPENEWGLSRAQWSADFNEMSRTDIDENFEFVTTVLDDMDWDVLALCKVGQMVNELLQHNSNFEYDIHEANIMFRGTQPVIIDAIYSSRGVTLDSLDVEEPF